MNFGQQNNNQINPSSFINPPPTSLPFFQNTNIPSTFIAPPEREDSNNLIQYYTIDSKDRNHTKFPTPSKYQIYLSQKFKQITSFELIFGHFPQSKINLVQQYLYHSHQKDCIEIEFDPDNISEPIYQPILKPPNGCNANITYNNHTSSPPWNNTTIYQKLNCIDSLKICDKPDICDKIIWSETEVIDYQKLPINYNNSNQVCSDSCIPINIVLTLINDKQKKKCILPFSETQNYYINEISMKLSVEFEKKGMNIFAVYDRSRENYKFIPYQKKNPAIENLELSQIGGNFTISFSKLNNHLVSRIIVLAPIIQTDETAPNVIYPRSILTVAQGEDNDEKPMANLMMNLSVYFRNTINNNPTYDLISSSYVGLGYEKSRVLGSGLYISLIYDGKDIYTPHSITNPTEQNSILSGINLFFTPGLVEYGEQYIEKVPKYYKNGVLQREIIQGKNGDEIEGDIIYEEKKIGEKQYGELENCSRRLLGFRQKKYEIPIDGIVKISNKVYTDTENCKKNITIIGTNTNFKEDLLINDIIFLYKRKVSKADANTIIKKNCGQKSGIVKVGAVFITNIVSNTEFCGIELYDTLETSNISCKFSDKKLVNDKYFDVDGQCCENNLSLINDDEYYIIRGTISGENISIFNKEPYYITMHIDELPRYKSLTKPNDDAFALIPLHSD